MASKQSNKNKIFLIEDLYYVANIAGYKARLDAFDILKRHSSNSIVYNYYKYPLKFEKRKFVRGVKRKIKEIINYFIFKSFLRDRTNLDTLVIRYPFETNYNISKKIYKDLAIAKKQKQCKVIFLIIDIDGIRRKNQLGLNQEIELINMASDLLIVHNLKMAELFQTHGLPKNKLISLGIFDYLYPNKFHSNHNIESNVLTNIIFAGNLEIKKSGFLYHWKPKFPVFLYGIYLHETINRDFFEWMGEFDSNQVKIEVQGLSFGLVWDGNSIETCAGAVGEYMKYSNPHKASLYLSQEIPIIVWNQSAIADLVIKNNLGFTIGNLNELDELLPNISMDRYLQIKESTITFSEKIRNGYFLTEALNKSFKAL